MSLLLVGLLLLHLTNCVSSEQSGLEENFRDNLEETTYSNENLNSIDKKVEELLQRMERMEHNFETKTAVVENLQNQHKNQKQEVASLKSEMAKQCKAEVKKEVEKVVPSAVEQGLRELPFEMVCAYKYNWGKANSVVNYDRVTVEFNDNSNRPRGGDRGLNIETGVFTTVTSGYYIITFSGSVNAEPGDFTQMYLYQNGLMVEESLYVTNMGLGSGRDFFSDQGSKTVVSSDCL